MGGEAEWVDEAGAEGAECAGVFGGFVHAGLGGEDGREFRGGEGGESRDQWGYDARGVDPVARGCAGVKSGRSAIAHFR